MIGSLLIPKFNYDKVSAPITLLNGTGGLAIPISGVLLHPWSQTNLMTVLLLHFCLICFLIYFLEWR